jgi:uncharacterized membrane-anchored protein
MNPFPWRTFETSKVPEITFSFWFVKVLSTAMGEATSDFFVHRFAPEAAVLVAGIIFVVTLVWQLRAPRYLTLTYWSAVVMVSVFGTMCADVVHVGLGVAYVDSSVGFALALLVIFTWWHRSEGTLSIHSIVNSRRELFYWATVTSTFALGTAVGDMSATTLHLGYFGSGLLFAALMTLPAFGYRFLRLNAIGTFWTAYVLTRPMGASFADWFGVSHERGGLNWGPGTVSIEFSCLIVVGVAAMALRERASVRNLESRH